MMRRKMMLAAVCIAALPLVRAGEPPICAMPAPAVLANASESELAGKLCMAVMMARIARMESGEAQSEIDAAKRQRRSQRAATAKAAAASAEFDMCVVTSTALGAHFQRRFGKTAVCGAEQVTDIAP